MTTSLFATDHGHRSLPRATGHSRHRKSWGDRLSFEKSKEVGGVVGGVGVGVTRLRFHSRLRGHYVIRRLGVRFVGP